MTPAQADQVLGKGVIQGCGWSKKLWPDRVKEAF